MARRGPTNSRAHRALAATLAVGAFAFITLRLAPPQSSSLYPPCPIHQFTGLLCPGCGATRALAALTRGHLIEALQLNPLAIVAFACAAAIALIAYTRTLRGHQNPWPRVPPQAIAASLAITAVFTLLRNLP